MNTQYHQSSVAPNLMLVDGRAIAREILKQTKLSVSLLPNPPKVLFYSPTKNAATLSYLKIKERSAKRAGFAFEETSEPAHFASAAAAIVQLPLPVDMDSKEILNGIPLEKDADVLSDVARSKFEENERGALLPPVVDAIKEILERSQVAIAGTQAVVIGDGWLVGEPARIWLAQQGARVTVLTKESGDLSALQDADIVVSGAGSPGLIRPEHLKKGVVLIDAGTSESDGAIVGDADPACAEVASVFTPVPGGVGPIAVACLFRNAGILALRTAQKAL